MKKQKPDQHRILDAVSFILVTVGIFIIGFGFAFNFTALPLGFFIACFGAFMQAEYQRIIKTPPTDKHTFYKNALFSKSSSFKSKWWRVLLWFPIALIVQTIALSCLCHTGTVKTSIAMTISAVIALRGIFGIITDKNEKDYKIYIAAYFLIIPPIHFIYS